MNVAVLTAWSVQKRGSVVDTGSLVLELASHAFR